MGYAKSMNLGKKGLYKVVVAVPAAVAAVAVGGENARISK
jgi:hypothetical protein